MEKKREVPAAVTQALGTVSKVCRGRENRDALVQANRRFLGALTLWVSDAPSALVRVQTDGHALVGILNSQSQRVAAKALETALVNFPTS